MTDETTPETVAATAQADAGAPLETTAPVETPADSASAEADAAPRLREQAKALLVRLTETYPAAFPPPGQREVAPLMVGIHKQLAPLVQDWGFDRLALRYALGLHTRQLRYQLGLVNGPHRVDLAGQPAGEISAENRELARQKVAEIQERRKQLRQQHAQQRPSRERPARQQSREAIGESAEARPRRPRRPQEAPGESARRKDQPRSKPFRASQRPAPLRPAVRNEPQADQPQTSGAFRGVSAEALAALQAKFNQR
ncbi:MAG TPA: ProQ/FinO family protein [Candidatus Competibacteraceae bacterium]|nr:ProQ/FinO family protein [Candidatus Competibacteraceae bacterium]